MTISHSLPAKHDDSSKLTNILTNFAEEIIDISVVEHVDTLEHQEVSERLAHYANKLGTYGLKLTKENTIPKSLALEGLSTQEIMNQIDNQEVSEQDRTLVTKIAFEIERVMSNVQIEKNEDTQDIVVHLGEE